MSKLFKIVLIFAFILPPLTYSQNLLSNPESVAYDSIYNRYLVSNIGDGEVVAIDPLGNQSYFYTGLGQIYGNCIVGNTFYTSNGPVGNVWGIDLTTEQIVFEIQITGLFNNLDGMTTDNRGFLYIVDTGGQLFKVNLSTGNYWVFRNTGLAAATQDVIYDEFNDRLLLVGFSANAPVQAVSLTDSSISNVGDPPVGNFDGITIDQFGNVYLASYAGGGGIWMFDNQFQNDAILVSAPHNQPAGLDYNRIDNILAVPSFSDNSVDFIQMQIPILNLDSYFVVDFGNFDGRPDPGEDCQLFIVVTNSQAGQPATNVVGELSCSDPAIDITGSTFNFGNINPGEASLNSSDPYEFSVLECEPHFAQFTLTLSCDETETEIDFELEIGRPPILLVDDDGLEDYEIYYSSSLNYIDIFIDIWDESAEIISAEELNRYEIVIWETGDMTSTLTVNEQTAIQSFLDGGGSCLISSKNLGQDIGGTEFYTGYMHAEFIDDWVTGASYGLCADGCPFMTSDDSLFFIGGGGAGNNGSMDIIEPEDGGQPAVIYNNPSHDLAGIYYEGDYKLIYLAFPLETVSGLAGSMSRSEFLSNVLGWFGYTGVDEKYNSNVPDNFNLLSCYPNPFNSNVNLHYMLTSPSEVDLSVYNIEGQLVEILDNGYKSPGKYMLNWDASSLPSGLYFVNLNANGDSEIFKLLYVK